MSFDVPTLPTLIERADADLSSNAQEALRRSDQQVLSRVHAGTAHGLYGYLSWIALQILPDTCDEEMLLRYANLRLTGGRRSATSALGSVQCTGLEGSVIDAGVLMQYSDGRRYAVTSAVTLGATPATVPVQAVEAGSDGNLAAGVKLTMVSPVLGVQDQATVLAPGITGGTPEESVEELRQRVIRSFQVVAHGGSASDYVTWALEVPGVTRAWCIPGHIGVGTVGLIFVRDNDVNPIPDTNAVAAVAEYIDTVRPVAALEVYVGGPTPKPVNFQIHVTPDTTAVRAAVEASLRDLLTLNTSPGSGLLKSHIDEAISGADGETDHQLVAPAADVTATATELVTFGGITWL